MYHLSSYPCLGSFLGIIFLCCCCVVAAFLAKMWQDLGKRRDVSFSQSRRCVNEDIGVNHFPLRAFSWASS